MCAFVVTHTVARVELGWECPDGSENFERTNFIRSKDPNQPLNREFDELTDEEHTLLLSNATTYHTTLHIPNGWLKDSATLMWSAQYFTEVCRDLNPCDEYTECLKDGWTQHTGVLDVSFRVTSLKSTKHWKVGVACRRWNTAVIFENNGECWYRFPAPPKHPNPDEEGGSGCGYSLGCDDEPETGTFVMNAIVNHQKKCSERQTSSQLPAPCILRIRFDTKARKCYVRGTSTDLPVDDKSSEWRSMSIPDRTLRGLHSIRIVFDGCQTEGAVTLDTPPYFD